MTDVFYWLLTPSSAKNQTPEKSQISFLQNIEKHSTKGEYCRGVSFEWSHHMVSSADSKERTTVHVCVIDSRNERVYV